MSEKQSRAEREPAAGARPVASLTEAEAAGELADLARRLARANTGYHTADARLTWTTCGPFDASSVRTPRSRRSFPASALRRPPSSGADPFGGLQRRFTNAERIAFSLGNAFALRRCTSSCAPCRRFSSGLSPEAYAGLHRRSRSRGLFPSAALLRKAGRLVRDRNARRRETGETWTAKMPAQYKSHPLHSRRGLCFWTVPRRGLTKCPMRISLAPDTARADGAATVPGVSPTAQSGPQAFRCATSIPSVRPPSAALFRLRRGRALRTPRAQPSRARWGAVEALGSP